MTEPTRTCRYCCPACRRHFTSLAAFDAHRVGDHQSSDPATRRRCVDPRDVLAARAHTAYAQPDLATLARTVAKPRYSEPVTGECRMLAEPVPDVPLWSLAPSKAQAAWLAGLHRAAE